MDLLRRIASPLSVTVASLLRNAAIGSPAIRNASFLASRFQPNGVLFQPAKPQLLAPPSLPMLIPSCGFKVVGKVKRRCKDCYLVVREQRLYNICKTKPRHKQMSMKKQEEKTWILTSATMGPKRPW